MNKDGLDELFSRGVVEVIGKDSLKKRLKEGEKLRIKLGIDPTSPNVHIGHAVPLLKLKDFQDLGHKIVLIVGDFTAVIGDTSDKDSERPMLTKEEIEENKKTYFKQVGKIIDLDKTELRYNSEWLEPLTYREIGEHANMFSVADFIARDNIKRRLDAGKRVSLREVLYPLMQGYDSVAVESDIELGGNDQRFNILAGRTMQEGVGQKPQGIILCPLIPGLDGRKMSKSYGNAVSLTDDPNEMYGKIMSLPDEHVETYFKTCTRVDMEEVKEIIKGHPKEAKMRLAREIVSMYHSEEDATSAENNFENTFSQGGIPEDVHTYKGKAGEKLVDAMVASKVVSSKTEWRRFVENGAITNMDTNKKLDDPEADIKESGVWKIGKQRFIKIEV